MNQLTFANPVFVSYAIAAALMIAKMMGMSWLTVLRMTRVKAGFRNPEDERKTPLNPNPSAGQYGPNEYVDRIRRIHMNDIENVPLFLAAGLLFVLTGPPPVLAAALFYGYVVTRLLHFAAYLTAQTHDVRALFWTLGSLIVLGMTAATLVYAVAA